ncbi:MAG: mercuric reductase [Candidatus Acidiferrales bacterium]|jgi:pyruvate/2-oxoglutarate dehydrogenase complex dihydrolipoamide dehydrogenase (E3) component
MNPSDQFQAIVIGSGQGGNPLCMALARAGIRTAMIERKHVGGTCVNEGCTPTKTMVASARVAYLAKRGADYGVHTGEIRIDMERIRERKRNIVDAFRTRNEVAMEHTSNLELIFGEASFTGAKAVRVRLRDGGERLLTSERIFINAGARPKVPPIDGLKDVAFLDSTSIMELASVPEHLIVLGGGYIGLEFGQMFRRFGSHVTILQSGGQLLAGEDADVAGAVAAILKQDGIEVLLNTRATGVTKEGAKIRVTVSMETSNESRVLDGSHLLVATGRTPNTDSLNISAAGVKINKHGYIQVNSKLETNVPGIFALGDIKGGPAFTHISYDDFRILRTNLIEKGSASTDGRMVPYTLYIDPQLGRIGLTESEARAQNKKVRVARMPMTSVARALETDETRGFMKALVDPSTDQILGAAILGLEGGEIMSILEVAMMGKVPCDALHNATFAHPTLAESLNNLFLNFES